MQGATATLGVVRRAVRSVIEDIPDLESDPILRRRLANRMVGVSLEAAKLLAEEQRLSAQIADRARHRRALCGLRARPAVAAAQAAGDFHRRTAVDSAAGCCARPVMRSTFLARDVAHHGRVPGDDDLGRSSSCRRSPPARCDQRGRLGSRQTPGHRQDRGSNGRRTGFRRHGEPVGAAAATGRERQWRHARAEQLKAALEATDDEVGTVDEDDLEGTLLPLVRRKLGRIDRPCSSDDGADGNGSGSWWTTAHSCVDEPAGRRAQHGGVAGSQLDARHHVGSSGVSAWAVGRERQHVGRSASVTSDEHSAVKTLPSAPG